MTAVDIWSGKRCINLKAGHFFRQSFFYLFILVCLSGVFYLPDRFTDRFFISGKIWMGFVIGGLGLIFPFIVGRKIKFSGLVLGMIAVLVIVLGYMAVIGNFSWQHLAWGVSLCLFMLVWDNSAASIRMIDIFFLLSLLGWIEAMIGIAQYVRLFERYHSSHPVTGTFENPAGLAACLAVCFPAALYFVFLRSVGWRMWGWMVAFIIAFTVVLSGTRTGMIALGVVAVVCFCRYALAGRKIPGWMKIVGIIVGMGVMAGLYFLKKDSANGRILVWRCSGEMFCDAPLIGHGPDSFQAKYMDYQAAWLTQHPDERWVWLADNVKHPFNEYLKIGVEYGSIGLLAIVILVWCLWRLFRNSDREKYPVYWSLLALGICAMFSYPLNYPAVGVLLFLLLGLAGRDLEGVLKGGLIDKMVIGGLCVLLLAYTVYWRNAEIKWYCISQLALAGKTKDVIPEYSSLYPFMYKNPLFLYNYGAELHEMGLWNKSIEILEECSRGMNDTDVQMLLADNYLQLEKFDKAERHYQRAACMCPNRFLPLYYLVNLYRRMGRDTEARRLAQRILKKPVKVSSYTIEKIRKEMQLYVE